MSTKSLFEVHSNPNQRTEKAHVKNQELDTNGSSKIDRYGWRKDTAPGELRMVNKHLLDIDPRYQRGKNESKAIQIAADFSWPAFGALVVALRSDGRMSVIDGQHRGLAALRRSDVLEVPCVVFRLDDVTAEARAFLETNTLRRPLTGLDKFKAQIMTNDQSAKLVEELIAAAGRIPGHYESATVVRCISTLTKAARTRPEVLTKVWPLVVRVCEGVAISERILEGLIYIEEHLPAEISIMDPRWATRIAGIGSARLIDGANRSAAYFSKGGPKVWAEGILNTVNKGLREDRALRLAAEPSETM